MAAPGVVAVDPLEDRPAGGTPTIPLLRIGRSTVYGPRRTRGHATPGHPRFPKRAVEFGISARSSRVGPAHSPRSMLSSRTQLPRVPSPTPTASETPTILRPSSSTIATASVLNSSGNDRRALGVSFFHSCREYLLEKVTDSPGEAHGTASQGMSLLAVEQRRHPHRTPSNAARLDRETQPPAFPRLSPQGTAPSRVPAPRRQHRANLRRGEEIVAPTRRPPPGWCRSHPAQTAPRA